MFPHNCGKNRFCKRELKFLLAKREAGPYNGEDEAFGGGDH